MSHHLAFKSPVYPVGISRAPPKHPPDPSERQGRAGNVFRAGTVRYGQEIPTGFTLYMKSMQNLSTLKDIINLFIFYHY